MTFRNLEHLLISVIFSSLVFENITFVLFCKEIANYMPSLERIYHLIRSTI